MADKVVELRKTQEERRSPAPATAQPARTPRKRLRMRAAGRDAADRARRRRYFYLGSGRYISTDNAYVGAQKVLITPDISGKVASVIVREGQHVKAGDALFEIDPEPFRIASTQAEAKLASVRTDFTNLKSNLASIDTPHRACAQKNAELKKRDVERKTRCWPNRARLAGRHATTRSTRI